MKKYKKKNRVTKDHILVG